MPVDLSTVGLKGIEAGQNTLSSIANREALESQTTIANAAFNQEQEELSLLKTSAEDTKRIMAGEGRTLGTAESTEDDMARFLQLTGSQLAAAGAPKRGQELVEASLDLRKRLGEVATQGDNQNKLRLDNISKASQYMYGALADSLNESEYQFNMSNIPTDVAEILGPEMVETLRNTPWSPEFHDFLKQKALTTYQGAQLDLQMQNQARADRVADDAKFYRDSTHDLAERRFAAAEQERLTKEKAGGTNISKAPTSDERTTIRSAIAGVLPDMGFAIESKEDSLDLMGAINDLTGEAKQLLDNSPGLTFTEAANRAVLAAKARGDFEVLRNFKDFGVFETEQGTERRYKPKGKTAEDPAPFPSDRSKMVRGRFYIKNGKIGKYGTDFE